jgi:hypothetical protein
MSIFIFGGSNSLRRGGWTTRLNEMHPQKEILNKSIGAATTLLALFRLLSSDETGPKAGDTVVWEYALNDANHVHRGYNKEIALKNVERFIYECQIKELKVCAAIFTHRTDEIAESRNSYYEELKDIFHASGVEFFDVSELWRTAHSVSKVPSSMYLDESHYSDNPELMDFICHAATGAIEKARVPKLAAQGEPAGRVTLKLCKSDEFYQNSLVKVPVAPYRTALKIDVEGTIIGVVSLAHPNTKSGLRLELSRSGYSGSWVNISISSTEKIEKPILKVFSLENAVHAPWKVSPGDSLTILPMRRPNPVYSENHTRRVLQQISPNPAPAFIGLLVCNQE